jgi:hypothetical protein
MSELLAYAVFGVVLGPLMALYPYRVARFEERLDAIGSKRSWSEVEPADWKVMLTKVVGAGMALFGVAILGAHFFG